MGLASKWLKDRAKTYPSDSSTQTGYNAALKDCADELSAALSLSEEEREAVARIDACMEWESTDGDVVGNYNNADMNTLRALIARFTNIGEVK